MNKPVLLRLFSCLIAIQFAMPGATPALADDGEKPSSKVLEVGKTTEKQEIRDSQIGFRDTLLFYTFKEQKAVLKLQIDNKNKTFPIVGTIFVFADDVTEEGLAKWLNNQHSDGLFPEVPEPVATHKLPAESCKVVSHKLIDRSKEFFGEYDNYSVAFEVKDHAAKKGISLKGFSGTATVHIKTK